ncbi:MAG TPA: EscU/YscU/HrcU family type III secretion system export apparatus switch protein [Ramlibacter sp.]|jgi:flagellar biosynthetic protein FlhB|nr:EscU/YscU/HrcU family type III secretion system export apparatus switch protein [Ramlibacter sp.]
MADQDIDRSEPATPHKLEQARERGQTGRSTDAVACAVFMAAMLALSWHGVRVAKELFDVGGAVLAGAGQAQARVLWAVAAQVLHHAAAILLPLLLVLPAAAILASIAQTGAVFSLEPLQMDFERISPAAGIKRLFSLRTLFDGARACVKLVVLTAAAALALANLLPQFPALSALPPHAFLHTMVQDIASLGWTMAAALVAVALADLLYTQREFARKMRMSRRELKDEFRNREGDPRIRARLRQLRQEMLKRSMALKNTRTADVVLTNPTHYAVALRYVHGEMEAPRLVAKGAGHLAAAMREIAARHQVIVVQNPPLARRLFREAPLDGYLPASFHAEVARIIVWVLAVRQQRARLQAGARA